MEQFKTVWVENSPDSLCDIATRFCLRHPETYSYVINYKKYNNKRTTTTTNNSDDDDNDDDNDNDDDDNDDDDDDEEEEECKTERKLLPGIYLPVAICEKFFSVAKDEGFDIDDDFCGIFQDTMATRLRTVSVRGSSITDVGLGKLLEHKLRDLDIHNCAMLSIRSFLKLTSTSQNLVNLTIGNSEQILPYYIPTGKSGTWQIHEGVNVDEDDEDDDDEDDEGGGSDTDEVSEAVANQALGIFRKKGYILNAPNLARLCIRDLFIQRGQNYMELLLKPLGNLTHLDLSGLYHNEGLEGFEFLKFVPKLVSLVLHNVLGLETAVKAISQLRKLKHLDLSQSKSYDNPNTMLKTLVCSLTELESLDISGTNLAGSGVVESSSSSDSRVGQGDDDDEEGGGSKGEKPLCDIPGLVSRVNNPLNFLGLYKTYLEASSRPHIPAIQIAGDSSEAQILTAGQHYLDRPKEMENVLNDLFHVFRSSQFNDLKGALDIILLAMEKHPSERVIQISGSASLYYIVISRIRHLINVKMKRKIIVTLLNGMFSHKYDPVMMRNGCITLCQFTIPQDVLFDYERLVKILLFIVSQHNSEENNFVERAGIFLLNSLACQVDGQQKLLVGNLGAMERMLDLIRARVQNGICDDVMETAWSTMWNVTDETPINCKRFLDSGGMDLFLECKSVFPNKQDLLRNMMGLLGNVAEVPSLRPKLMTKEFVAEFSMLLDSNSDGIEVSYNAAGVLAHMASDGPEAWTIDDPTREEVLDKMVAAIDRWNLNTKRNINYRSFEPILRLVTVSHTPQCQHWAIWALANLTRVDMKYCSLVEEEGGLKMLEELINSKSTNIYPRVVELAMIVQNNVSRWKEKRLEDQRGGGGGDLSFDDDEPEEEEEDSLGLDLD